MEAEAFKFEACSALTNRLHRLRGTTRAYAARGNSLADQHLPYPVRTLCLYTAAQLRVSGRSALTLLCGCAGFAGLVAKVHIHQVLLLRCRQGLHARQRSGYLPKKRLPVTELEFRHKQLGLDEGSTLPSQTYRIRDSLPKSNAIVFHYRACSAMLWMGPHVLCFRPHPCSDPK